MLILMHLMTMGKALFIGTSRPGFYPLIHSVFLSFLCIVQGIVS
ncbi:hypothetical protein LINPERPRIM_LOCUS18739 [Linum perenne]